MTSLTTKSDLAKFLADRHGLRLNAAEAIVEETLGFIRDKAAAGKVRLAGLGTFEVRGRAARTGRNPKTGETVQVAARAALVFRAQKSATARGQ